ncbi:glycosyl transferase family 2 [Gloeothece citriformis PCC 7424]|uniref:Glycosyl transferase family 2 n=1 Tax=Gloeothece citriformis (strain PCC 7424) TaxID=65393 RepID=B7KAI5_GLOC7|nr:glycosyltransferase [Gloeothece citriformis]ACK72959.1 glycosyl transferase family 2 [Gloeothece citriformis PCC 7424]
MPKISVIVPTYNAESTILETVNSVLNQTFKDFELIIIDDGCTDKTLDLIGSIKDSRIKVFSAQNGGLPVARNRGIRNAVGDYISFIDADDLWTPNKLEKQLKTLEENPSSGVAYSWTTFIDKNSQILYPGDKYLFEGNVYPKLLTKNIIGSGSNILVKRKYLELVGEFDPSLKSCEDWEYNIRLAKHCCFKVVPEYQILYRKYSQSMSYKVDTMEKAHLIVINRSFENAPKELQHLKKKALANAYKFFAKLHLENALDQNKAEKAIDKFKQAIDFNWSILLERETQNLLTKIFLLRFFAYQVSSV